MRLECVCIGQLWWACSRHVGAEALWLQLLTIWPSGPRSSRTQSVQSSAADGRIVSTLACSRQGKR